MNTQLQTKNKYLFLIKIGEYLLLISLFFVMGGYTIMGQEVTAEYDGTKLIIKNNTKQYIILFKEDNITKLSPGMQGTFKFTDKKLKDDIKASGLILTGSSGYVDIAPGKALPFDVKTNTDKIIYYVAGKTDTESKNHTIVRSGKVDVPKKDEDNIALQSNSSVPEHQEALNNDKPDDPKQLVSGSDKTNSKPQSESNAPNVAKKNVSTPPQIANTEVSEKANTLTQRANIILDYSMDLNQNDRTTLQNIREEAKKLEKEIKQKIDALWEADKNKSAAKRKNTALILSYNKSVEELSNLIIKINKNLSWLSEAEIVSLKNEYQESVVQPFLQSFRDLLDIKEEIEKRKQSTWWGWMGINTEKNKLIKIEDIYENIKKESNNFINLKKEQYVDLNDIAVIEDLKNDIPHEYNEIENYKDEFACIKVPYIQFSVVGILLLLLAAGVTFYIRTMLQHKKIKRIAQEKRDSGESGLLIEEDDELEVLSYNVDLSEVKEKNGTEYCEIAMPDISDDITIKSVYFSRQVILDIYKFFDDFLKYDSKTNETGCQLVGRWEYVPHTNQQQYNISIETVVEPGDDAVYGEYNLNFGVKIEITRNDVIENLREKTKQEYVHTAWMHSHPGLGLFLSAQDLNVQSQLAHSQHPGRMLAIVIDSHTPDWEMALFTPKQDGKMNNDKDVKQTVSLKSLYLWAKTKNE